MWRVGPKGAAKPPDMLVIDLDPGPPATIVECCRVAELVRAESDRDWYPKTSGSKGMQLYARASGRRVRGFDVRRDPRARRAARTPASRPRRQPDDQDAAARKGPHRLVAEQPGQDHDQRLLAARPAAPHRSTPISWDEVAGCTHAEQLVFEAPRRAGAHLDQRRPVRTVLAMRWMLARRIPSGLLSGHGSPPRRHRRGPADRRCPRPRARHPSRHAPRDVPRGLDDALAAHTKRMLLLEGEYLRRFPDRDAPHPLRTRSGSRAAAGQD